MRSLFCSLFCSLALLLVLTASAVTARAHGIQGHIHVTGWAIENLPDGELRDFFADPTVMNAALFGAAFTDSGYWPQGGALADRTRAYSEHTHWEPFIQEFVVWMLANDPPPWTSLESRQRAAFLMGCGSHGLQDEIFDSLFLYQVSEEDGKGQSEADPGSDGFMALDGHLRFAPEVWMPMDTLVELYQVLGKDVTASDIEGAVSIMQLFYLGEAAVEIATSLGNDYKDVIPWTRDHYMEPGIPGSLVSEITPTMHYMQAIWDRLHGTFTHDDLIIHAYPEAPRRLHGTKAGSPDTWVTLVTGLGIKAGTATVSFTTQEGDPVAHQLKGTRWGGLSTWGRLVRYLPAAVEPAAWYTVGLDEGAELMDGSTFTSSFEHTFQAPCDEATAELCADLGEIPAPSTVGPEPEPEPGPELAEELGPEQAPDAAPPAPDAEIAPEVVGDTSDLGPPPVEVESTTDTNSEPGAPEETTASSGGCAAGGVGGASWLWALLLLALYWPWRRLGSRAW